MEKRCIVIAEAGLAHGGSVDNAYKLVDAALNAGADMVKFQVYRTEEFISKDSIWFDRYKSKELSWDVWHLVKTYADNAGISWFATSHHLSALRFLVDDLNVKFLKVGSGECGNWQFIKQVAKENLPTFISVGMYEERQIDRLARIFKPKENLTILHCVTEYPTVPANVRLNRILYLYHIHNVRTGYSDHTIGWHIPLAAVAMGATVIEKHLCLEDVVVEGQDRVVSLTEEHFRFMVQDIREIEDARGYLISQDQMENRKWALKGMNGLRP